MRSAVSIAVKTFSITVGLSIAVLAAGIARGAGPVVGWGAGAPQPQPEITASAVAAAAYHSCAIEAGSAAVVCWGDDSYGQTTPPAAVDGSAGTASAIALGGSFPLGSSSLDRRHRIAHSCAIQAGSGAVVCWGSNLDPLFRYSGQATPPPSVDGTAGTASAIAVGAYHSCAIQAGSGAVVCWGYNLLGRILASRLARPRLLDPDGRPRPPTCQELAARRKGPHHGYSEEETSEKAGVVRIRGRLSSRRAGIFPDGAE